MPCIRLVKNRGRESIIVPSVAKGLFSMITLTHFPLAPNVLTLHLDVSISNCPNELCNGLFAVTEEFTQ